MTAPLRAVDAGLTRRLAAVALDGMLVAFAFTAVALVAYKLGLVALPEGQGSRHALQQPGALLLGAAAAALGITIIVCWRWLRGTPGALLMGVNVVRARDGARAGVLRLTCRLALIVCLGGLGSIWSLGGRAALHDRLTGTRAVVEDEASFSLAELAARAAPR